MKGAVYVQAEMAEAMINRKRAEAGPVPVDSDIGNEAVVGDIYWLWESGLQSARSV